MHKASLSPPVISFPDHSKAVLLLWIYFLSFPSVISAFAALWSPVRKGLTSWLYVCDVSLCFCHFPIWCPRSGEVLDCIKSWSFPSLQVSYFARNHDSTHRGGLEREHNPYNNLPQEDDHNISHKMNSWPHRWTTTHITGRPSSTSHDPKEDGHNIS